MSALRVWTTALHHFHLKKELFLASETYCTPPGWNDLFYVEMVLVGSVRVWYKHLRSLRRGGSAMLSHLSLPGGKFLGQLRG
jgi:hypothetical protein